MKQHNLKRSFILCMVVFSLCSMFYLETQNYCIENDVEISHIIENAEIKSILLPDVFIIENILKSLFNFRG